ncbi:helix-turn-helix domain-containing protein [Streptomyces diacarni]|uniref:winged helix-turn-helix transcriptional regulator n=1 Tax=Streptomyces diacarni TaxID=2800381 RepID=UPI0033FE9883
MISRFPVDTSNDLRQHGGAHAYLQTCPSRFVLPLLTSKWALLTVGALQQGPLRFNALRRRLDGVTQKMLTQALRTLERDGLVTRTVYPTIPPKVVYELTALGRSLTGLLTAIQSWSQEHEEDVLVARRAYDRRAAKDIEPVRPAGDGHSVGERAENPWGARLLGGVRGRRLGHVITLAGDRVGKRHGDTALFRTTQRAPLARAFGRRGVPGSVGCPGCGS